ncbi:MAG: class I SAM-dependent methyltransferase [Sediminibacterium sp.]|nr:class I SAM-dependent methyltransferase [Sediminibacterium sp.]
MSAIDKEHWEKVFSTKPETEFSWFQAYPATSVAFLDLFNLPLGAHIIDIGGGDSHLVDVLIERGYQNIYVLDISENALNRARQRLGNNAGKVHWIVSDVVDFEPPVQFDFWHDRAAFHFLTTPERIEQYVNNAEKGIKPGGYLILGTFSESGPKKCSGLEIKQYTAASMSRRFEEKFHRVKCIEEEHATPFNTTQNFLFCSFMRKV